MKKKVINLFRKGYIIVFAVFLLVVGLTPKPAIAHEGSEDVIDCGVLVWITEIESKDGFGETPDFYANVWINGIKQPKRGPVSDRGHAKVWWGFELGIPCDRLSRQINTIDIQIKDDDSNLFGWLGIGGKDDPANINPDSGSKDLKLSIYGDFDSPTNQLFLYRLNSDDAIGVLAPQSQAFGRNASWGTGYLTSEGSGSDRDAKITYEVVVIREPDFRVTKIEDHPEGTLLNVKNFGGPGILTKVGCRENIIGFIDSWVYEKYGEYEVQGVTGLQVELDTNEEDSIILGKHWHGSTYCTLFGTNWFGGPEPHRDNNALVERLLISEPETIPQPTPIPEPTTIPTPPPAQPAELAVHLAGWIEPSLFPKAGEPIVVKFKFCNIGGTETGNFTIRFRMDGVWDSERDISAPSFSPGQCDTAKSLWITGVSSGSHTVEIFLDANNDVQELNESNNYNYIGFSTINRNVDSAGILSLADQTRELVVENIAVHAPVSTSACQRPMIASFYATLPPLGSEAVYTLHYEVEGADKVEIFGNVLSSGVGTFDVYGHESPTNWALWTQVDGMPDSCFLEKVIQVTLINK